MNFNLTVKALKHHIFAYVGSFIPVDLRMIYRHAFHGAQVASEATFHTAVSGAAINNLAKTFWLNFLRALQTSERFVYKTQQTCSTLPGLEMKNSLSGKGTMTQNKIICNCDKCVQTHRFKSGESLHACACKTVLCFLDQATDVPIVCLRHCKLIASALWIQRLKGPLFPITTKITNQTPRFFITNFV